MTYANHPLTEAARYGDAQCEERGLATTITENGLELDAIMYVAEQRALRITIMVSRGPDALTAMASTGKFESVRLTASEQSMLEQFKIAYLDGLFIGWTARSIADRSSNN
jgi:hypothetical protein